VYVRRERDLRTNGNSFKDAHQLKTLPGSLPPFHQVSLLFLPLLMKAVPNLRWTNDPFAAAFMPPPDETEDERAQRVHEQAEAARVSREIDEDLQEAKKLIEKRKKAIKVLLLGRFLTPTRTSRAFIPRKVKPSLARARPSRVSVPTHSPLLVTSLLMIGATNRRLPTLLLSFSIQTGKGGLEIGHPAQSHQVILSARPFVPLVPFSSYF
jgi:hypothetical protein